MGRTGHGRSHFIQPHANACLRNLPGRLASSQTCANYYNFYADNDWGAADSYDVAINSGKLGVEKSIEVLAGICEHL